MIYTFVGEPRHDLQQKCTFTFTICLEFLDASGHWPDQQQIDDEEASDISNATTIFQLAKIKGSKGHMVQNLIITKYLEMTHVNLYK
jgi:hypothetical protein